MLRRNNNNQQRPTWAMQTFAKRLEYVENWCREELEKNPYPGVQMIALINVANTFVLSELSGIDSSATYPMHLREQSFHLCHTIAQLEQFILQEENLLAFLGEPPGNSGLYKAATRQLNTLLSLPVQPIWANLPLAQRIQCAEAECIALLANPNSNKMNDLIRAADRFLWDNLAGVNSSATYPMHLREQTFIRCQNKAHIEKFITQEEYLLAFLGEPPGNSALYRKAMRKLNALKSQTFFSPSDAVPPPFASVLNDEAPTQLDSLPSEAVPPPFAPVRLIFA